MRSDLFTRGGRGDDAAAGFTLLELLVVLVVLSLLLVLIPQLTAGVPQLRLHLAAAEMADLLRQTRNESIRTGLPIAFMLDAPHKRYRVDGLPDWQSLPANVQGVSFGRENPIPSMAQDAVWFYADGSASGGVITLRNGARHATVTVDWLTGRVRTDD